MAEKFYICFYHDKRTYKSENKAYLEARRINRRDPEEQFRVFYCDATGGYHHTSITQSEMSRRQQRQEGGNGKKGHEHWESQRRRHSRNPKRSPKLLGRQDGEDRVRGRLAR